MMSSRGALLALAAWLGMLGAASAFGGAVPPLGAHALRRAPLCASGGSASRARPRATCGGADGAIDTTAEDVERCDEC